jgi:hypothetical protein
MPITYNEAEDIWEVTDLTEQEKVALTEIAIQQLTDYFGEVLADRIVGQATEYAKAKKEALAKTNENTPASPNVFEVEGQVGQA